MLRVRIKGTKSWLDPRAEPMLSARLKRRLTGRLKGEKAIMITLTYRREEWSEPYDLYKAAQEDKHVPKFMQRLSRGLGRSLVGKWIRKMEFQRGGWLHYHIILCGFDFLKWELVEKCWGHGFVWLSPICDDDAAGSQAGYVSKGSYVAKGGEYPTWLYFERARSVKIIAVSKGFWSDNEPGTWDDVDAEGVELEDGVERVPDSECWITPNLTQADVDRMCEEDCKVRSLAGGGLYKTIGQVIDEASETVEVLDYVPPPRSSSVDGDPIYNLPPKPVHRAEFKCEFGAMLNALFQAGVGVCTVRDGWMILDCDWIKLAPICRRLEAERAGRWGGPAAGRGGPDDGPAERGYTRDYGVIVSHQNLPPHFCRWLYELYSEPEYEPENESPYIRAAIG